MATDCTDYVDFNAEATGVAISFLIREIRGHFFAPAVLWELLRRHGCDILIS
jgi:hypothetical protein